MPIIRARGWDIANSKPTPSNNHSPDLTVGCLLAWDPDTGLHRIEHFAVIAQTPGPRDKFIRRTAAADARRFGGSKTAVLHAVEQAPGAGKDQAQRITRRVLAGYRARGVPVRGTKAQRADAWLGVAADGFMTIVDGPHVEAFFAEAEDFNDDPKTYEHDDYVDAVSIAYDAVHRYGKGGKSKGAATARERVPVGDQARTGARSTSPATVAAKTTRRRPSGRAVRPTVRVPRG